MKPYPASSLLAVPLALLLLAGCGGPGSIVNSFKDADLTKASNVGALSSASAGLMFVAAADIPASYAANNSGISAPACPEVTDDGKTVTVKGGCTDDQGVVWTGSATFVRSGGSFTVPGGSPSTSTDVPYGTTTFDAFGTTQKVLCAHDHTTQVTTTGSTTGSASITGTSSGKATFTLDIEGKTQDTRKSCTPTDMKEGFQYQGTVTSDGQGRLTLSGSGVIGTDLDGKGSATTTDEVYDATTCNQGALSGKTVLTAGGHTAEIDYQGGKACGTSASWTLDGKAQGTLAGVSCAAAPGRGGMPGLLSVLTVLGLALLRRRRAPRGG